MNRTKISLQDYLDAVALLKPDYAVTPIEEVDMSDTGKKKIQRAVKHSI